MEEGRPIKIGYVSPRTGALAFFGLPDGYCVDRWNEYVQGGLVCGDGKLHTIEIIVRDSQSSSDRAAQVAAELINNDNIDLMLAASTADTVPPVADQCEANEMPMISTNCPWQPYFFGRGGDPKVGFKWTYHFLWGMEDVITSQFDVWNRYLTNKKYGAMWPNDADGNAYRAAWTPALKANGYELVDGGSFQPGQEDFTSLISLFKKEGVELVGGVMNPPDFTVFWQQALQQDYKPQICTVGKALLFNQTVEAIGEAGLHLSTPLAWSPGWPYKSYLTGETNREFADEYERRTGKQWSMLLAQYASFEVAVDVLRRTTDIEDKDAIMAAITTAKVNTIQGEVDFTAPVDMAGKRPVPNVFKTAVATGQWVKGTKWPFDCLSVGNAGLWPELPVEAELVLLS